MYQSTHGNDALITKIDAIRSAHPEAMLGVVTHYERERGYGFVTEWQGNRSAFLHIKTLYKTGYWSFGMGDIVVGYVEDDDTETSCDCNLTDVLHLLTEHGKEIKRFAPEGRISGRMKIFVREKGFGFLVPDDGGPEIFVHINQMIQGGSLEPQVGARFSFEIFYHGTRIQACNMKVLGTE